MPKLVTCKLDSKAGGINIQK